MASALETSEVERWISSLRFKPFLTEATGDLKRATRLYVWNAQLAGALLETFGHVEVLVRNAVHAQMKSGRPTNSLKSWLVDADLLDDRQLVRVQDAIGRIKQAHKTPNEDRVVAALSMGFWTAMLGRRYEQLWRESLRHAFPYGDGTRNQVAGYINRVVTLRNRVAHHECLLGHSVSARHSDALALARTVDLAAEQWIASLSRAPELFSARP